MLGWPTLCVENIKVYFSCCIVVVFEEVSEYEELVEDVADKGHRPRYQADQDVDSL